MRENLIPVVSALLAFCVPYTILAITSPNGIWQSFLLFVGSAGLVTIIIRELFKVHHEIVKPNGDYIQLP
jgi:hypothetical protein